MIFFIPPVLKIQVLALPFSDQILLALHLKALMTLTRVCVFKDKI